MNLKILGTAILVPVVLIFGLLILLMDADQAASQNTCGADTGVAAPVADKSLEGLVPGYDVDQLANAAAIMRAAAELQLTYADQVIGVMTALGESGLRNIKHGDAAGPDSLGLFQQRDNGAWGSRKDRLDPTTAATNFFKALARVEDRHTLEPTIAAHRVQRNADPYHYRPSYAPAQKIVAALAGRTAPTATPASTWNLGKVQPQLVTLVDELTSKFAIKTVGGYRESATDPNGHPAGLAADFMVPTTAKGESLGDQLAAYAQQNHQALRVDYILWKQHIWSAARAAEGWRKMADRGSITANHFDHVHINVLATGAGTATPNAGSECIAPVGVSGWTRPVKNGIVTSRFGMRTHPIRGDRSFHDGDDYGVPCGTPIVAANSGLVVKAGPAPIYGHQIVIDHGNNVQTKYGHMYAAGVKTRVGATVSAGQVIGAVGSDGLSTGCHLHFSVTKNGTYVNPTTHLAAATKEQS